MPEGSHLRVRQSSEEGDHSVHHVLVIDDAILTLTDQNADKFAEVVTELFPHRSWHGERIIPTILLKKTKTNNRQITVILTSCSLFFLLNSNTIQQ